MKDYKFLFIQGFYQHLTESGQLNWLDKTFSSSLIWRYVDEINTFKDLKNICKIKCLFAFVRYISAMQLY